jgi:hypothetical protein
MRKRKSYFSLNLACFACAALTPKVRLFALKRSKLSLRSQASVQPGVLAFG